jgi:hypothetical protein
MMTSRRILKCRSLGGLGFSSSQRLASNVCPHKLLKSAPKSISIFSFPEKSEEIFAGGLSWFPVRHICSTGHGGGKSFCLEFTRKTTNFAMFVDTSDANCARSPPGSTPPPPQDGKSQEIKRSSGSGSGGSNIRGGSSGRDGLTCPKCGDPCIHVETFVCKY